MEQFKRRDWAEVTHPDGRVEHVPWGQSASLDVLKRRARIRVNKLLDEGKLTRPSRCQRCRRKSKLPIAPWWPNLWRPLEFEWLCRSCSVKAGLADKKTI